MKYIFICIAAFLLLSCKEKEKKQELEDKQIELETGALDSNNQYTADEIGWTVNIPINWEVWSKKEIRKHQEMGEKEIEKSLNKEVDVSGLKQLLNLKKDRFNSFLSSVESYDENEIGSYREHISDVYNMLKQAYASNDIYATFEEDSVQINGLLFYVFKSTSYAKDKPELILRQAMYSRLINGYDFGMTIIHNKEESLEELKKMIFSSKFSKRD
jgi:hypothetical protein